jgi:hypothetical protein
MAFGIMVTKWCILCSHLCVKLSNVPKLINTIARLHNYCISEQGPIPQLNIMYRVHAGSQLPHEPTALGNIPSDATQITSREGVSHYREILKQHVASNNLVWPLNNMTTRALQQ